MGRRGEESISAQGNFSEHWQKSVLGAAEDPITRSVVSRARDSGLGVEDSHPNLGFFNGFLRDNYGLGGDGAAEAVAVAETLASESELNGPYVEKPLGDEERIMAASEDPRVIELVNYLVSGGNDEPDFTSIVDEIARDFGLDQVQIEEALDKCEDSLTGAELNGQA